MPYFSRPQNAPRTNVPHFHNSTYRTAHAMKDDDVRTAITQNATTEGNEALSNLILLHTFLQQQRPIMTEVSNLIRALETSLTEVRTRVDHASLSLIQALIDAGIEDYFSTLETLEFS